MARPRVIRKRIISIKNINKITRTMERVAQSRTMKLASRLTGSRAFRDRVAHQIRAAEAAEGDRPSLLAGHPLCLPRAAGGSSLLLVITSNRGLCGGYNTRVLQAARRRIRELDAGGSRPVVVVLGRRGTSSFRYAGVRVAMSVGDIDEATPYARWNELMSEILRQYAELEASCVEVASMRYVTKVVQEARVTPLLPLDMSSRPKASEGSAEPPYVVEPSREAFLLEAVALMVRSEMTCLLVEALLSEQIQRTMAMRNATDSGESMVKRLSRSYNRARQAQVTGEMMEIVGGAEGLTED